MACASAARKVSAVLYHYPCPDGAFAALAAHLYFSAAALPVRFFPNTVYDPIRTILNIDEFSKVFLYLQRNVFNLLHYRSDALPFDEIKDVYLLDFVGPPGFVHDIAPKVDRVTILDHHKTALETLCGNATLGENVIKVIDMQHSGATIAFDFFKNKLLTEASTLQSNECGKDAAEIKYIPDNKVETVHKLFKFIEDGDLWRWKIPNSKAFSSGLKDLDIEFNVNTNCKLFDQLLKLDPEHVISRGQATLSEKQRLIDDCLDKSYEISLGCGQFGNCLKYGGGGHRNASSFMLSVTEFERWKVRAEPSKTEDA
ncbi:hypothetical protein PR202_gb09391 [Eleusine coracana subsp. coracana]|uniref:Uncharacterized protein n=1 Tax=Eleusine coracana subsp. coracana TaxID=191504 RepID=A0AAV5EHF5_ELECO|nr:hypothetical protein PR202_gb09391 [Eleusine coracana subsp. coracana]